MSAAPSLVVGIDFGTTNSSLSVADAQRRVRTAQFPSFGRLVTHFRSVLYFSLEQREPNGSAAPFAGPQAIETYLDEAGHGRLMQSLKSFLPSVLFDETQVLRDRYKLEELIGLILSELRTQAEWQFGDLGRRAVVGRPVQYVGAESSADETLALERMRRALDIAGFDDVVFEYEPTAAALRYEARLASDENVLVADFGGGTSDFCLMRVGPAARRSRRQEDILATGGVPLAGDIFDSRIVYRLIAPCLGLGSRYRSESHRWREIPPAIYRELASWHRVAFLNNPETIARVERWERSAEEPEKLGALRAVIEDNLGFELYQLVAGAKQLLSDEEEVTLDWRVADVTLDAHVSRAQFEGWISDDLERIATCLDALLRDAALARGARVDRVFLTGGSSLVPAVRRLFEERFGASRIGSGDELTAVSSGLALRALERSVS